MRRLVLLAMGLLALASSGVAMPTSAQEPLVLEFEELGLSGLSDPLLTAPNLELRVRGIRTHFVLPLWETDGGQTRLLVQPEFDLVSVQYRNDSPSTVGFRPDRLHDLGLRFVLQRRLAPRWQLLLTAEPALVSDLKQIGWNHFGLSGGALARLEISPQLTWRFGVMVEKNFGEPLPLPALQLDWRRGRNLHLQVNLPQSAALWRVIGRRLDLGMVFRLQGNQYRIGEDASLPAGTSTRDGRVRYSLMTLGPSAHLHLVRFLDLRFETGAAFARRFEIQDVDDIERLQLEPKRTWFTRGTLRLRH